VPQLLLEHTDDVLRLLVAARQPGQVVVGFAAETGDAQHSWLDLGREKLARKQCDLLVVNQVGDKVGFESEDNAAVILARSGAETPVPLGPKDDLAHTLLDALASEFVNSKGH
jgi:phosphopantothenoylcysteine decarboxylase / phosphopantothenate---cysteine ligase